MLNDWAWLSTHKYAAGQLTNPGHKYTKKYVDTYPPELCYITSLSNESVKKEVWRVNKIRFW